MALRLRARAWRESSGNIAAAAAFESTGFSAGSSPRSSPADRFRELPWKFLGRDADHTPGTAGYFKILLVSHSACRTGAPLCLLRLAEELSRLPDVECFIVLQQGGELDGFLRPAAPTLDVEWLVAQGINRHDVPAVISSAFHEFSSRGVAVCNTLAVSEFHEAFREDQVEVLSWIHELPTFIALLGGDSQSKRSSSLPARSWCRRKPCVPRSAHGSASMPTAYERSTTARTRRPKASTARPSG